jgi:hypothetical protein
MHFGKFCAPWIYVFLMVLIEKLLFYKQSLSVNLCNLHVMIKVVLASFDCRLAGSLNLQLQYFSIRQGDGYI